MVYGSVGKWPVDGWSGVAGLMVGRFNKTLIRKAFVNNILMDIKLSKAQLSKNFIISHAKS